MKHRLAILGATGSVGKQALEVVSAHSDLFQIIALAAHSSTDILFQQCLQFQPLYAVVSDYRAAHVLSCRLQSENFMTHVLSGPEALLQVAYLEEVDIVLSSIVGAAGLLPTMAAIKAGKRVLLANKESLVMAGDLMMSEVRSSGAVLLPIDSEHNALFQCLPDKFLPGQPCPKSVDSLVITASGGPFLRRPIETLSEVTPEEAIVHPNWSMGAKISVDSATMMNKGFELIEARYLFDIPSECIDVWLHPQSLVHAFVRYRDGSMLAHIANADMRVPIAHALSWPNRIKSGIDCLDYKKLSNLSFDQPNLKRYPCLRLAYESLKVGGTAMTVLNAANEVAVAAFLSGKLMFSGIAILIEDALAAIPVEPADSIEKVLEFDARARNYASLRLSAIKGMDV